MTIIRHRYHPADPRLGRHVKHDSRSLAYTYAVPASTTIKSVDWPVNGTLDQGQIGACTGNALAQWLNTAFAQGRLTATRNAHAGKLLTEADALSFYHEATVLDDDPGTYPPDDTGSNGLSVAKAGVKAGYLSGYQHVLSFNDLLLTLQHTPVIVGTEWLQNMFTPGASGVLRVTGAVEGGHEYLLRGVDVDNRLITMHNSWAATWGKNGDAYITFYAMARLLAANGDITVPVI